METNTNNLDKRPDPTQEPNKPANKTKRGWMWLFNTIILPFGIALGVSYGIVNYYITTKNDEISELKGVVAMYEKDARYLGIEDRAKSTVSDYERMMLSYEREKYLEWFARWSDKVIEDVPASEERTAFLKDMELALKDNKVSDEEYKDIDAKYEALLKMIEIEAIVSKIKPITSKG
jgi:hypothetical protein